MVPFTHFKNGIITKVFKAHTVLHLHRNCVYEEAATEIRTHGQRFHMTFGF